jgi:hypothetical protein
MLTAIDQRHDAVRVGEDCVPVRNQEHGASEEMRVE